MNVAEFAAMLLERFDHAAVVVVDDHMGNTWLADACKAASTEYLLPPVGVPKVIIVPAFKSAQTLVKAHAAGRALADELIAERRVED
jgi:hypothetical protein